MPSPAAILCVPAKWVQLYPSVWLKSECMILVTGASGYVGSKTLAALSRQGFPAAGMVRTTGKRVAGLSAETPLRIADYDDPRSLLRAFEGVSTLLLVSSDGDGRDLLGHHANAIEAAASRKKSSIVFTSIIDIDADSPFYFTPVYRDAERRLRESGLTWTILRCGLYSDLVLDTWIKPALSSGVLSLPTDTGAVAPISRQDVALAAAAVVASPMQHAGKTYELTGPRKLSFHEMTEAAGSAFGHRLEFAPCSPADYLQRAWAEMQDPWPHAFSTLCRSIEEGRYQRITNACEHLTGHPPTDFRKFVEDTAASENAGSN
ncbi:NAD(P)H-binding protein [Mesorhizobium sp. Root695]|uniref:NAD(P)H-binding protein n=1 Tax=Mesorhizobium sp. Root695 TaxID=1736589 RepID=UPI000AA7FD00|nr:NAD(P)H-binding protein [Mesorhizobium sp. Root695]